MTYVVKTETTKPANVQWFGQANPVVNLRLNLWVRAQPGILSAIGRVTAPNTFTTITVFQDEAAYNAFQAALASNADGIARQAYATAQNFQTTTEVVA